MSTILFGFLFQFQDFLFTATPTAPSGDEISNRLENAGTTVQSVLTGLVVIVGVIFATWRVITGFPAMSNPHEKQEVYKGLGNIALLTGVAAAMVWIVPWAWSLMAT